MTTRAAITGVGMSDVGRKLGRPAIDLLVDAALEALADADLERADIDGVCTYPGKTDLAPGMSPLGVSDLREALGLKTRWHSSTADGPAQMSAVMVAAMAVMTGQARHVLVFRTVTESSSQTETRRASVPVAGSDRVDGWLSWLLPVNAFSAANWMGWVATRYMHETGLTRDLLGKLAVAQRDNARHNPRAVFRDQDLTLETYLNARMISSPLGLFDCDIPIDGACVIVVSAADAALDRRKPPIWIEAMGSAMGSGDTWDQQPDLLRMAAHDAAEDMWARTDLKPQDVDVLSLYDGFSIQIPLWLEAFGFCGRGEAPGFIADGHTLMGGRYPVNTGGGQLSAGRLHGYGLLHESCIQLWGEGGGRQVPGARTAVCGMGGGPIGGAMLLVRQ